MMLASTGANPDRVRVATQRDEDELINLCRSMYDENGVGDFNEDKVRAIMRRAFTAGRNDPGIIGVVGQDRIEGSICLVVDPLWYGDTPFLQDAWNYVLPEYRTCSNAKDLIAFAVRLSEPAPVGIGIPLWMSVVSDARLEAKTRLYRRQLGEPVGMTWLYGHRPQRTKRMN